MRTLDWFSLSLPRDLDLDQVTAVLRPLAHRPRYGLMDETPIVVFEVWSFGGQISWRLGLDERIARELPAKMAAHLPRLGIQPLTEAGRPKLTLAADTIVDGLVSPLRVELAGAVSAGLASLLGSLTSSETAVVQWSVGPSRRRQAPPESFDLMHALGLRERRQPDARMTRGWTEKTSEPLLACRGRVGAFAASNGRASTILHGLADALKLANNARSGVRVSRATAGRATELTNASTRLTWSALLNARELAAVLGWPIEQVSSDALPLVGGHINPVPARLLVPADNPDEYQEARVLGESLHPAQYGELVTMPIRTALHHVAVTGPTGSGKSTLLASWILADIAAGRGALVLEPRGDLVADVVARMPEHRREDLVIVRPGDARPVGFNPLGGPNDEAERRADQIVSLLRALHGDAIGPRTADLALHALITVARAQEGSLADVPVLLTNAAFRRRLLAEVSDPLVLGPYWAGFDAMSDGERQQVISPLMNKLRAWLSRSAVRQMLGQAEPRFNLEDIFRHRRVVLVALNEGVLGAEAVNLIGCLPLSQFWNAVQRRAAIAPEKRHPVVAVVDEYQRFMRLPGVDFGDVLAQSRGLGVSWTLAHQHLDQLSPALRAGTLANARSRVVFRPAPSDARPLATALGGGLDAEDLLRLRAYEACAHLLVDGQATRPFSVRTRPLSPWTSNPDELRAASAKRYGIDGEKLDRLLLERWQGKAAQANGPIGAKRRRPA
jgi:hypothetical protein